MSAGKALLGVIFVLIFSAGLACSIVLLGLLLVIGKNRSMLREDWEGRRKLTP